MAAKLANVVDVVVVGAGFAGLSAAVRLAKHGARVAVLEARSRLGGRATAFPDRETGELVDNGQHVLLGSYTATFDFLREIGAAELVSMQKDLAVTMIDRRGVRSRLVCPPLPPPMHLLGGVLEWDALGWKDRLSILHMAAPMRIARRALRPGATAIAASPGETVENWLIRNGQTPRMREMLWEPLAVAALNQPIAVASAPPFARVLAEMFGADPRAAAIGVPRKPLHEMYAEPARRYIEEHGGTVRTGAAAVVRLSGNAPASIEAAGERWTAGSVISSVPWHALADAIPDAPASLAPIIDRARRTSSSPIVTVNLWFDRQVIDEPFVGLPGRAMQWVFDKRVAFGGEASHLSLVSSGAASIVNMTNEALIAQALQELLESIPAVREAALVRATVIREPRATFSLAPGEPARPQTVTPVKGLFLAGDWIDTGLPATIESAVRSGHAAADQLTR
jgi:squalene-associated FAD-dependent desaturase